MAKRVLGVLAGKDMSADLLLRWARSADLVLAADGGANRLVDEGFVPSLIVGDMDSATHGSLTSGADIVRDESQVQTDCDKLLSAAAEKSDCITLASVEGDLPDHELATLASAAKSALAVRIAYRRGVGWIVRGGTEQRVATTPGQRVSLLPLVDCAGTTMSGVKWPLDRETLSARGLVSISNRAHSSELVVSIEEGVVLLFVEYPAEEMPFW